MKGTITASVILSVIIIFCICVSLFTFNFCTSLRVTLEECIDFSEAEDWTNVKLHLSASIKNFKSSQDLLLSFMMHQDVSEIENSLLKIDAAARVENRDLFITETTYLTEKLNVISTSDIPNLQNIF